MIESLLKDFRFGVRTLLKRPGSSIISVLAFGLGIGLCTTVFSLVYGVFGRGLGVPDADELFLVHRTNPSENIEEMRVPQHDFYDWRDQQQSFEGLAGYATGTVNVSGTEGPERLQGAFVTANVFDLLQVRPVIGSGFRQGDDAPGAPLTVILGHDVWETRHNSDSAIVGQIVKVNGEQATVLGVMPDGFMFPADQEIWVARRDLRAELEERGDGGWYNVFGRLKDGVTRDQAELEFATITTRLAQQYPESNEGVGAVFETFVEDSAGDDLIAVFGAMQIATLFVLLIACANVANLLLARATLRTKEAALRSALGATTYRVVSPFFAEAVILTLAGSVLGIAIAFYGVALFDSATQGVGKPYFMTFAVDLPVLVFVLVISAITALVSGAAPAYQISKTDVNAIIKDEARGSSRAQGGNLSKVLVIGEIALSCALLVGAGLMTRSIVNLNNYDFAFEAENVFTARVGLFETDYPDRTSRERFFSDLLLRLRGLPGGQAAALSSGIPPGGSGATRFAIEGETYATDQDYPRSATNTITPGFFDTFGIEVSRGRDFMEQDEVDALPVTIVSTRFAERFFPGEDPIGRRIREGTSDSEEDWKSIIGVVPNLAEIEWAGGNDLDPTLYYVPAKQRDARFLSISVRTGGGDPLTITSSVREAVRAVDPDLPIYNVLTAQGVWEEDTWFFQVFGTLFIVFGLAALFMASIGLYGVLSFSVNRRVQEMGIRMALGAQSRDVIRLILRQGTFQLGIGLAVGLVMAFGLSNIIGILMFNVEPRDPMVFGTIVLVISVVGILASIIPARRATSVDPIEALRHE